MSFAETFNDPFFGASVTRRRFSGGALDVTTGYHAALTSADSTVKASVQRPTGKQLTLFPQGQRADEALVVYTAADFRTADAASSAQADQLVYSGVAYEVRQVSPWPQGGFSRLLCTKVGQ